MNKLILSTLALALFVLPSCGGKLMITVRYSITGTAKNMTIGAQGPDLTAISLKEVAAPWEKEFQIESGRALYLDVINVGEGDFTAQILVDGEVMKEASGSGPGAKVSMVIIGSSQK